MSSRTEQLQTLLQPAVEACACELWGIELMQYGRHVTLRVYIDKPEGVTVEDCADVSHQVSGVMDVEDPIKSAYNLEVSSPGMDRPLFSPAHYQRYIGETVALRLIAPVKARRKWQGVVQVVTESDVTIVLENGETETFGFDQVDKANLVPVFD